MNAKVEHSGGNSPADRVKLWLAGLVVVAGIVGFYYFANQWPVAVRAIGLVVAFVLAIVVGAGTHSGRALREYIAESQFELRKVVWPTREETVRTTGVIIVVVIIISIVLGLIDLLLKVVVMDWLLKLGQ
ncbi:MAG: preprotein translocase subunit SecE [Luteimonas sp.]|uniref:preprotein translocase subunit SecE n=1 Tax=Dokdonella sp. TaxID=2291710 RepID=UPI0025C4D7AF|nr:preprotein translocase subunit SecE [Dokdonella sp.]MBX3691980.1 preprotein translocase subunit SecE [Dokdonella sp.]MCW5580598.1 preprotein translocase subunit SecE [Luteimonas sp.]